MNVETFEQTEVVGGKIEEENSPEAIGLIETLGLKGQAALTTKTIDEVDVRCPYRAMTKKEIRVYSTLYPDKVQIEDYRESMIPLRVLQVAAHAKNLQIYKKVEVWCETGKPVDPVLVGIIKTGDYSEDTHILARWGDALESFEVLYEKAKKEIVQDYQMKMLETKRKADEILASLEHTAIKFLNGEWPHLPQ